MVAEVPVQRTSAGRLEQTAAAQAEAAILQALHLEAAA
jgi:hypothetical protein